MARTKLAERRNGREALYQALHPANFEFHVIACDNDGVWNETGATLSFTLLPA
jgi:hypothetical protein